MIEALNEAQRATLRRLLLAAICPPRLHRTRESAFGTASYETLLRSRGPIGPLTRDHAQTAIILSGFAMGIITRDASGNMVRV
jgi:hypothetical protein